METLVKKANENITSLQSLIDAQNKKISIVSYSALPDGSGYELLMSDGSKIELKNGKDGNNPTVGIKKHNDGLYYWTIDGEFMRDADGNMIKAEGQDGADGFTPTLRVNMDGNWEVSTDNGKTWQEVKDADGNPVKAEGKDATVDLIITEDENSITIVYNGKTFVIPKNNSGEDTPTPVERPILAIEYVHEYNVNVEGSGFISSQSNSESGYFTWDQAVEKFGIDKNFTVDGKKYHLPSREELTGIVPDYNGGCNIIFNDNTKANDVEEKISIGGGVAKTYTSDYRGTTNKIAYGLRFKDTENKQFSAWRYSLTTNEEGGQILRVTVRYLGPDKATTKIEEITDEEWWNTNNLDDISRDFPLSGIQRNGSEVTGRNDYAMYWVSTDVDERTACNLYIYSAGAYTGYSYSGKQFGTPIRLFCNELK